MTEDLGSSSRTKRDVTRGLAWVGLSASFVAVLDFLVILIILANWVSPDDYGIAVMAMLMFPILDVASELGLAAAVIQRDDHTPDKISTVFWLNVGMSTFLFGVVALAAPAYASFHGHAVVGTMLTVYGTKLIWQNIYFIPQALMRKQFRYKELSIIRIIANVVEFSAKITFAATGYGIWCFLLGRMAQAVVLAIGTQIANPWRPRFVFKVRDASQYLSFGLKTSASQILFQIYTNVDYLVVSWFFGKAALGFYKLAYDLVLEPVRFMAAVIIEIAFPTFVRLRHKREELIGQFITFTRMNLVVVLPFLAFLMVCADDLLFAGWGAEWLPAATTLRVLCIVGIFRALSFVVPPLLDGVGRPSLTLVYTAVASIVLPASYVLFAATLGERFGYLSVAIAWAIGYPLAFAVLAMLALISLELRVRDYLRQVVGVVLCAVAAGGASWVVRRACLPLDAWLRALISGGALVVVLWILLSKLEGISPRKIMQAVRGGKAGPLA